MNKLALTAELRQQIGREVFCQTFERYWHPTGYNFVPDAVEKISIIAYIWFCELAASGGNDGSYRKRLLRPIVLKEVEKELLTAVFKNTFGITIEWMAQNRFIRLLDCASGKQAVRILPKNLVGLEELPVTKYYARASWAPDNPHIKSFEEKPPLPAEEPVQQLFVRQQLQSDLKPDVALKSGERAILTHGFLLATHSSLFVDALQPTRLTEIDIGAIRLETMKLILQMLYIKSLPITEKAPMAFVSELVYSAHTLGFTSCVKLCEPLLCKKAETDYNEVVGVATELQLTAVLDYCKELKVVKKLPTLPFGTNELIID